MYVCVCNAITEQQVRKAVREGASTMRDLRTTLGVASECGRCACCARDCLRSELETQTRAPVPAGLATSYSLFAEAL